MAKSMAPPVGIGELSVRHSSVLAGATSPERPLSYAERRYLTEHELAGRWGMSPKTLARWRGMGKGPFFAKFSKKVAYPLDGAGGILEYEQRQLYMSTSSRVTA